MKYYIIEPDKTSPYRIVKVKRKKKVAFLKKYKNMIVAKGSDIHKLYLNFKKNKKWLFETCKYVNHL